MRAGGITAAGLIAGAVIGSALQSWLRVDIVPIGVSTFSFGYIECTHAAGTMTTFGDNLVLDPIHDPIHC